MIEDFNILYDIILSHMTVLSNNIDIYEEFYEQATNKYDTNKYRKLLANEEIKLRTLESILEHYKYKTGGNENVWWWYEHYKNNSRPCQS